MAETCKLHVRKGDKVQILSGKDKGKTGKIIQSIPKKGRVVVEGVNKVKRHTKPNQKNAQGGIIVKEAPIHVSNVMIVCPECGKASRIKKVEVGGEMVRACVKCSAVIDKEK